MSKSREFKIFNGKTENGMVIFDGMKKSIQYSFTDYIQANLQLSLVTCIDFTASNGTPTRPDSLHYV